MEIPILQDIVIILGLSVIIILTFQKINVPPILGFLITGIIAGPYALNLITAPHEVELLSEIGIIFLLFVIGTEFSLKGLSSIRNTIIIGGLVQVGGTIILITLISRFFGLSVSESIFMGFLFSLSSTAIVLKMLQEKGEITSPHGRISVAILIFQDLIVIPMMLVAPILAGKSENLIETISILLIKVAAVIALVLLLARYIVPVIFRLVVKTQSRELFILTVVVLCFATAWLTSSVGLSLALGAFFAGLIISESDYSHQATANILPFREIFISFFFVSVGMLLNLKFFIDHITVIILMALGVILLKTLIVTLAVFLLKYPLRTIIITSLSLFQIGEFSLLLSTTGIENGLLSENIYQYFLAISIISMGITPFAIAYASQIADYIIKAPIPRAVKKRLSAITGSKDESFKEDIFHDHLIIIGYGINGENVAKTAREAKIPYIVVELDPEAVKEAKKNDEPVIFGDAADESILKHIHIQNARVVVVAISDPKSTKKIVSQIRKFTQTAYIIVRTRYLKEIDENLKMGADEVIPEEFETSIEIFTRVLKKYLVPSNEIQNFIHKIRSHNYEMLRSIPAISDKMSTQLHIPDMEIATITVQQGNNNVVGKTVAESQIRSNYGITVLAIKRGNKYLSKITPETEIKQDDTLYLFGSPDNIAQVNKYFKLM